MPNTSGSPSQARTKFDTTAQLSSFDETQFDSGDMAWITTPAPGGLWVLNKEDTTPVDATHIVTGSGVGRWTPLDVVVVTGGFVLSGAAPNISASGFITAAVTPADVGKAVYVTGPNTVALTDAAGIATAQAVGFYGGTAGEVVVEGIIPAAQFTTIGGSPANGATVYLAVATSEAGAAGKLTATPPIVPGQVVAPMGIVLDNTNYAGAKTARVAMNIQAPTVL